jgi:hypothetical protein
MSDTASKGNVQSVAGRSTQCHTVTAAYCIVSLVAMLQQVAAEWCKPTAQTCRKSQEPEGIGVRGHTD